MSVGKILLYPLLFILSPGLDNTLAFLRRKDAENPRVVFSTLPRFDEVVLFE